MMGLANLLASWHTPAFACAHAELAALCDTVGEQLFDTEFRDPEG